MLMVLLSAPVLAGNGDYFFNVSGGWQWKNTVNLLLGLEKKCLAYSFSFSIILCNVSDISVLYFSAGVSPISSK